MGLWIFLIILAIFAAVGISRGVKLGKEQRVGHDRCSFCRTRLKKNADKVSYATTCSKCGRTQPWASTAS